MLKTQSSTLYFHLIVLLCHMFVEDRKKNMCSGQEIPGGRGSWLGHTAPRGIGTLVSRRAPAQKRLQHEFIVSPERCLCRALGIGLEAHNQY